MINSKPDTILMTADTVGGVWTYALDLCRVLQKHNIEVHLATMGAPLNRNQCIDAAGLPNVEIYESDFSLEWMDDPWKDIEEAGEWLLALEHHVRPDIIHLNNFVHGKLNWKAPVLIVGHSCVLSWWEAVHGEPAPSEWNMYTDRVKQGLQHADYAVAVSNYMMNKLQKHYGPLADTEVIYNTRNSEQFYPVEKEQIIFCMSKVWDKALNISVLQQISGKLPWQVYAAGVYHKASKSQTENLTLTGRLSQASVAEWLSKSSIYIMPTRYEPFGLSILEAAMSECALVLSDIPSLKEIWGSAAIYADPDNPDEWLSRINDLIASPAKLKLKAKEAKKRARYYSMDLFELKYMNLYHKLLLLNKNQWHEGKTSNHNTISI